MRSNTLTRVSNNPGAVHGEFIASRIFDIALEESAVARRQRWLLQIRSTSKKEGAS